jgi:hypothetical protein
MNMSLRFRGISGSGFEPIRATGGTIQDIQVGNLIYRVHTFLNSSQNFSVSQLSNDDSLVEYLVVAGGGAGGAADNEFEAGAGGGAGGLRSGTLQIPSVGNYSVVVGDGGVGRGGRNNRVPGLPGQASSFYTIQSAGGGGGLAPNDGDGGGICDGGSGGGGTGRSSRAGLGNIPATVPPQGNNGNKPGTGRLSAGGGGGGAGGPAPVSNSFLAGPGASSSIRTGSSTIYSSGGQGGNGTLSGGASASPNTGNGGMGGRAAGEGAGNPTQFMGPGGSGGSGIVIVRYVLERL